MAKLFGPPDEVHVPEFDEYFVDGKFSIDRMRELEDGFEKQLREWLRNAGYRHRLTGEVIRFPRGDGYAMYMIMNGQSVVWLPLGDRWQAEDALIRGLRASDLADMVKQRKALEAFFSSRQEEER